jgi:hypothetical protein
MSIRHLRIAATLLALSFAGAVCAETPVAINEEMLPPSIAAIVKAKAQEGPRALLQYLHRTRMVHQLHHSTLVRDDFAAERTDRASRETKVAAR